MPPVQSVKFHFRAMTNKGDELLIRGEGDPGELERNLAPAMDEYGFFRPDCSVFVWYEKAGQQYEFLAASAKGPAGRSYYTPSREVVLNLITKRQASARLSYIVQIVRGWIGDNTRKTETGIDLIIA